MVLVRHYLQDFSTGYYSDPQCLEWRQAENSCGIFLGVRSEKIKRESDAGIEVLCFKDEMCDVCDENSP